MKKKTQITTLLLIFVFLFVACNDKSDKIAGVGDQKWKSDSSLKRVFHWIIMIKIIHLEI